MSQPDGYPHIVLYGALRSGSTLFRLILDHHPALHNPGETDFLLDHITPDPTHPTGWRYDRDALKADRIFRSQKINLPDDLEGRDLFDALCELMAHRHADARMVLVFHRNAEKIAALLPNAQVLHLIRDPRDVARSAVGMGWAGNSYFGADHWIGTETEWDRAEIDPERVLSVYFETLLDEMEPELVRVCRFLGVPYDPLMLTYHLNSSYDPPTPGIAKKWRKVASPREIARIEAKCGLLLTARGYEADHAPVEPHMMEALWLTVEHRIKRWQFNIRRYGAGLFVAHHMARVLGLKETTRRLAARQEAIKVANLK